MRTITVALDMSKVFNTINIHTLIRKLLQINIPGTIFKFIANYIKGHKAYTTYRNHTSRQRQFKTGVPQGGVLLPTLFNIYTSDTYHHPVHRFRSWPTYMTSLLHAHTQTRVQPRNTYNHTYNHTYIKFPYTCTYSSTPHNTNRKHNIHHIHYTTYFNTPRRKTLFLTTAATQQTFPHTPHSHYN